MTPAGLEELRLELERLRRHGRDEVAQRLREARTFGDDSNNDEYHAVREEQTVLEARIALLEDAVGRAVVIDQDEGSDGVAAIGSTLLIEDLATGCKSRQRLASAHSVAPSTISAASPVGQALLGAAPGTVVTASLPNGRSRRLRLLAVEAAQPGGELL